MHAYTGCDKVNAYAGRGKIGALRIVKEHKSFQGMFDLLGVEWELSDDLFQRRQDFTCQLYISCPGANSVNELTFRMLCSRRDNIESEQLPPCADCLYKHACRANYQTAIWRRTLENRLEIQSWKTWLRTRGEQARDWVDGWPSSIDSKFIASLLFLYKICKLPNCTCLSNGVLKHVQAPRVGKQARRSYRGGCGCCRLKHGRGLKCHAQIFLLCIFLSCQHDKLIFRILSDLTSSRDKPCKATCLTWWSYIKTN